MASINKFSKHVLTVFFIIAIFGAALYFAQTFTESTAVINLVERLSYFGVLLVAIIAGLNTFVPLPAATFVTVFTSAGLSLPLIIITLAVGTLIADGLGFMLGQVSREMIEEKYPKIFAFFTKLQQDHERFLIPFVFLYASFVPFPNEAILIPLALAGTNFKHLLLPLVIGNVVHQIILIYGINSILGFFG